MPFPCGGSSGVLSGLFFGGILFRPGILSACVGLLVPSRHKRHAITLLQRRHNPHAGRFPGVASLHHVRDFAPPWAAWRAVEHRPRRSAAQGADPPIWSGICRMAGAGGSGQSMRELGAPGERGIVADRFQNFIVAAKVARKSLP